MNYKKGTLIMKMAITIVITSFVAKGYTQEQKDLTKEEVLRYWSLSLYEKRRDSITLSFSSAINHRITKFIDSLRFNDIDSVIIFSTSYPGYSSKSKCDTGLYPTETFIIWNKCGETSVKKFNGACSLELIKGTSLNLFSFYANNQAKLKSEFFMPVIFNACLNRDKTLSYMISYESHEPNYFFFYKIGNDSRAFEFCESFLENKQSMFYDYNLALKAYAWWNEVKNVLDRFD